MSSTAVSWLALCMLLWNVAGEPLERECVLDSARNTKTCETDFLGTALRLSVQVLTPCTSPAQIQVRVAARNGTVNWLKNFASSSKVPVPGLTVTNGYIQRAVFVKVYMVQPRGEHVGMYELRLQSKANSSRATQRASNGRSVARGILYNHMCDVNGGWRNSNWWGQMSKESKIFMLTSFATIFLLSIFVLSACCCFKRTFHRSKNQSPPPAYQLAPMSARGADSDTEHVSEEAWSSVSSDTSCRLTPGVMQYQVSGDEIRLSGISQKKESFSSFGKEKTSTGSSSRGSVSFFGAEIVV